MITKVFWTIVTLDGIAAIVLWKLFERGTHGLLVAAYLVVVVTIVITSSTFSLLRSDGLRIVVFIVLLLPSAPLLYSSVAAAVNTVREQRQFSGSAYFQGPALELAQAMVKHDAGLVKQLIPAAGDLNQPHGGGTTLWQFGVLQADNTEESIDMLRALLAAGADPKRDASADTLQHAATAGPRLTQFLLEAGANPNLLDNEHRPLWWRTIRRLVRSGGRRHTNIDWQPLARLARARPAPASPDPRRDRASCSVVRWPCRPRPVPISR